MSFRLLHTWLLGALLSLLGSFSADVAAAQDAYAPPASTPASLQLGDPHARVAPLPAVSLADPADLELSQRSMAGPGAEVVAGSLVLLWTPVVSALVVIANGPGWFPCWDEEDDYGTQECQERVDRQQQRAQQKGIAVGVVMGLAGLGLVGHGAYRIRRIRQARKHVELSLADVTLRPDGASFALRASF
jgi:hypothetical protein